MSRLAQPRWSVGNSRGLRAYVLTGTSWDPSPLSCHGRKRRKVRMMKKRTRMNESHPHKTVICRVYVTRKSGKEKEKGSWSNCGTDLLLKALRLGLNQ